MSKCNSYILESSLGQELGTNSKSVDIMLKASHEIHLNPFVEPSQLKLNSTADPIIME